MFQSSFGYSLFWQRLVFQIVGLRNPDWAVGWVGLYSAGEGSRDCNADEISFLSRDCTFPGKGGTLEFQCENSWLCPANMRSVSFNNTVYSFHIFRHGSYYDSLPPKDEPLQYLRNLLPGDASFKGHILIQAMINYRAFLMGLELSKVRKNVGCGLWVMLTVSLGHATGDSLGGRTVHSM